MRMRKGERMTNENTAGDASIPDGIADAMAYVKREDAWLHADGLFAWMAHNILSSLEDDSGGKVSALTLSMDGRSIDATVSSTARHGERHVMMRPLLDDVTNVLYGFTFTGDSSLGGDDIVMPDDIIKSVPHGRRRNDGSYDFNLKTFVRRMGSMLESGKLKGI